MRMLGERFSNKYRSGRKKSEQKMRAVHLEVCYLPYLWSWK